MFSEDLQKTREDKRYEQNADDFWNVVPHELKGIVTPVIQNLEPRMLRGLRDKSGNGHRRDYKQLSLRIIPRRCRPGERCTAFSQGERKVQTKTSNKN
jgi:hypothetical protein